MVYLFRLIALILFISSFNALADTTIVDRFGVEQPTDTAACIADFPSLTYSSAKWAYKQKVYEALSNPSPDYSVTRYQCNYIVIQAASGFPLGTVSHVDANYDINYYICNDASKKYIPGQGCVTNPCQQNKGQKTARLTWTGSSAESLCYSGCTLNNLDALCLTNDVCYGAGIYTGATCTASNAAPPSPSPEQQCLENGKTYATVNGVTSCFPLGTSGAEPVTQKNTSTTTNTTNNTTTNTSTTTTTTTSVTVNNGTGAVTTTTNDGNGNSSTKTESKDSFCQSNPNSSICPGQDDFCEKHPDLNVCKNSTWQGACGNFQCDGDAVICAAALEQHKRNCTLFDEHTSLSDLGDDVAAGSDPEANNNPAKEANRDVVNLENSITEGVGIGSGGFTDKTFSLQGSTFTLPFSQINWVMNMLGNILLALAYFRAARIVGVRGNS